MYFVDPPDALAGHRDHLPPVFTALSCSGSAASGSGGEFGDQHRGQLLRPQGILDRQPGGPHFLYLCDLLRNRQGVIHQL